PAPDEAHGVDDRRLPELVPRRARPQHHALAEGHVHVPTTPGAVRRRCLRDHSRGTRCGEGGAARMKSFDDKVVAITGAGSGIGRALALNLARQGALLAISDVDDAGLAETVDLVKGAGVREVRSDHLDVADRAAFAAYASSVVDQFGRANVVVNNAGVA